MSLWWAVVLAVGATFCALSPPVRLPREAPVSTEVAPDLGWVLRWRWLWSIAAGVAAASFVSGSWGVPAGLVTGGVAWVLIGRTEPAETRRRRRAERRELPGLVHLLAAALETGCGVADGVALVCEACPGAAADVLATVPPRLALGLEPAAAWRPVLDDPELAPLARALVRAGRSGVSVTHEVGRLADELAHRDRADVEERARSVGVKAAVPLGLCLLPSFVLIGVVPLVVSLLQSLAL
jgi:Flp pilus assembly protein TadB